MMKPSFLFIGDPHFDSRKPWTIQAGKEINNYFKTINNYDSIIVLGDVVDNAISGGLVIKQVLEFFNILSTKCKKIFVLQGNHDIKYHHGIEQLCYQFLTELKINIEIITEPSIIEFENAKFLALPHYNHSTKFPNMKEFYNTIYPETLKDEHFDFLIGHFGEYTKENSFIKGINLSKYNTKHIILGDIHTTVGPNYTGSLYACKTSENDENRRLFVLDDDYSVRKEIKLPKFLVYKSIYYPDSIPLKQRNEKIIVYSFYNCTSQIVKEFYPHVAYIKDIKLMQVETNNLQNSKNEFLKLTDNDIFKEYLLNSQKQLSEEIKSELEKLLM